MNAPRSRLDTKPETAPGPARGERIAGPRDPRALPAERVRPTGRDAGKVTEPTPRRG